MLEGWKKEKIGNLVNIINGGTPSTNIANYWNGNIIWVTPSDITKRKSKYISESDRKISQLGLINSSATLVPKHTILLCTRATVGEKSIANCEMSTNQGFKNLICKNIDYNYMYYVLETVKKEMVDNSYGSTFLELSKKNLEKIEINMPMDMNEQKVIADVLTNIDNLIESLQKSIDKKNKIKRSILDDYLKGKKKLNKTGVWITTTIKNISNDITKGNGLSKELINKSGRNKCILYGELFTMYNELISNIKSFTNSKTGTISQKGDILIPGSTTTIGKDLAKACVVQEDGVLLGGDINIVRVKKEINPIYIAYLFTNILYKEVEKVAQGTTIIHLHGKDIEKIPIYIPIEKSEQDEIVNILQNVDNELNILKQKLGKYRKIKEGMMEDLLTGKVRLNYE